MVSKLGAWCLVGLGLWVVGCGGDTTSEGNSATGGAADGGHGSGTSGTANQGGASPATGGAANLGGSSLATGGAANQGGASPATGGAADGGHGSGTSGTANQGGASSGVEACTRFESAFCERMFACSGPFAEVDYGDVAGCARVFADVCAAIDGAPGYTRMVVDYDACAAAYQSMSCDPVSSANLPPACQTNPGSLANGAACAASAQCQSAYCKLGYSSMGCGVCAARTPVGGSCQLSDECEPGLLCGTSGCVVPGQTGTACDYARPCQTGLDCINGACATPLGVGAACSSPAECNVAQGLWCRGGTCLPITVASLGESCDRSGSRCRMGTYCSVAGDGGAGTCVAQLPNGSLCGASDSCTLGSECYITCIPKQYPRCL